jgi:hypothetical protein
MLSEGSGCGGLGVRLRLPLLVLLVRWIRRGVQREGKDPAKNPESESESDSETEESRRSDD